MKTTFASASSKDLKSTCGKASFAQLSWAIVFAVSLGVATLALRHWQLPPLLRMFAPAVPLIAGLMYVSMMVRDLRTYVDELQLRIYAEATSVIVCGLFIFMLTYPVLQEAGVLPALDYSVVMALMLVLGTVGYVNARRRYR